jgi:hypothetical protein
VGGFWALDVASVWEMLCLETLKVLLITASVVAKTMGRRKDTYRSNEGDLRSRHFLNAPGFDKEEAKASSTAALVEQLGEKIKQTNRVIFPPRTRKISVSLRYQYIDIRFGDPSSFE